MPYVRQPHVTVIIPVFNDRRRLEACLRAISAQTYPAQRVDTIVIDNGSSDRPEEVVRGFARTAFAVETAKGSYAARNRGIQMASGEALAFTDSDCIPVPQWIERGVAALLSMSNCGLVAGRVDLFFQNPRRPTAVELHESVRAFRQRDYVSRNRFGVTANVLTFRRVIDAVGPFDSRLKSGGDVEFGQRVARAGFAQVYADDARVAHPARRSLAEMRHKVVRVTRGELDLRRLRHPSPSSALCRFKSLAGSILGDLSVPLGAIYSDQRLRGSDEKAKVALVELFKGYCSARTRLSAALHDET